MIRMRSLALLLVVVVVAGCTTVTPVREGFAAYHEARPQSLLIVPVVNHSVDVQAPASVLSTLPKTLAEKGYYIFPVNTVKTLLEFEGLYEPAEVHAQPTAELADLFGADAVLYVSIHKWTSEYIIFEATTVVDFEYRIVHRDGKELWRARKKLHHTPKRERSGDLLSDLVTSAISAAIERADPHYLPLVRQANREVFYSDSTAIPPGPYAANYQEYYLNQAQADMAE